MSKFMHLTHEVADYVDRVAYERIDFIQRDHFVPYTLSDIYIREFEDILAYPKSLRMPCRALIGESQSGKTTLLREFVRKHPVVLDATNQEICPILFMEMPAEPDERRFWSAILQSMQIVHNPTAVTEKLEAQAFSNLMDLQVQMLIVDEFHNMLHGAAKNQRQFLAVVKSMVNRLQFSLVVGGTADVARALATDSQFLTRFEKMSLPKWKLNIEFRQLLVTFESLIPLAKPSDLASREKAIAIFNASGGTIGGVKRILVTAALMALDNGQEEITYNLLIEAIAHLSDRSMARA